MIFFFQPPEPVCTCLTAKRLYRPKRASNHSLHSVCCMNLSWQLQKRCRRERKSVQQASHIEQVNQNDVSKTAVSCTFQTASSLPSPQMRCHLKQSSSQTVLIAFTLIMEVSCFMRRKTIAANFASLIVSINFLSCFDLIGRDSIILIRNSKHTFPVLGW